MKAVGHFLRFLFLFTVLFAAGFALLLLVHLMLTGWRAHPLGNCTGTAAEIERCKGYNWYSGIGSSVNEWITTAFIVASGTAAYFHHHQCHVHGCHYFNRRWLPKRLSWHPSPARDGHPVCKLHHEHHPRGGGHTHVVTATGMHST